MARLESEDYYEVLGVPRGAAEAEIKSAYKRLALRWHPDKNPDSRDHAESVFKRVSEAYDVLGDADKRRQYDRYGKAAFQIGGGGGGREERTFPSASSGEQFYYTTSGGSGGGVFRFRNAQDIFNEFFGGRFGDPFAGFDDSAGDRNNYGYADTNNRGYRSNRLARGAGMNLATSMGMGGFGSMGSSPFDDPFFQTSSLMGSSSTRGGMGSFSSSFSSSSSGRGGVSKSVKTTTTIRNGQKVTKVTTTTRDANGNVTSSTQEHLGGGVVQNGGGNSSIRVAF